VKMEVGYLVRTPVSIHLLDKDMRTIIEKRDIRELTLEACAEFIDEVEGHLRGLSSVVVEEESLKGILERRGYGVSIEQPSRGGRHVRSSLDNFTGRPRDDRVELYRAAAMERTQRRISELSSTMDQELINLVSAHDTLSSSLNEVTEKLVDWVSLYFPELRRLVRTPEKFVGILRKHPSKEDIVSAGTEDVPSEVVEGARRSKGAPTPPGVAPLVMQYASTAWEMISLRERISDRISGVMGEIAPNTSAVAGPLLGAKLIAKAGGLDKLARLPSSSVQIMGAERALFRAMREGSRPPKHGLIFQHPIVHNAARKLRGKAARALASKITIACRIDTFSGSDIGEELTKSLKKRVDSLSSSGGARA